MGQAPHSVLPWTRWLRIRVCRLQFERSCNMQHFVNDRSTIRHVDCPCMHWMFTSDHDAWEHSVWFDEALSARLFVRLPLHRSLALGLSQVAGRRCLHIGGVGRAGGGWGQVPVCCSLVSWRLAYYRFYIAVGQNVIAFAVCFNRFLLCVGGAIVHTFILACPA